MPASTTWPALTAGARAKASEVEAKFDWLEQDLHPMSGGTRADNTYDIGSSSFRWRNMHAGPGSVGTPSYLMRSSGLGWYSSVANTADLAINSQQILSITNPGSTGGTVSSILANPNDSTTSHTEHMLRVATTTAGDPRSIWQIQGTQSFMAGIDNSDSDKWKLNIGTDFDTNQSIVITTAGEITHPLQPCFYADATVTTIGATSTINPVNFPNEIFDQNGDFDTATHTFTAPITGKYLFLVHAGISLVGSSVDTAMMLVTTSKTYENIQPGSSNDEVFQISVISQMTAGDTAFVRFTTTAGTGFSTTSVLYGSGRTYFSGKLVA